MQVKFAHTPSEKKQIMMGRMAAANGHHMHGATPIGGYYPAHFNPAYAQQAGYNPYAMPPPHMGGYPYGGSMGGPSRVAKGPDGCNLFVYGIPETMGDPELSSLFASFGNVLNAKVYRDLQTGKSRGFGFVSYATVDAANAACQAMDGYQIAGSKKRLTVKPKSDSPSAVPHAHAHPAAAAHPGPHGHPHGQHPMHMQQLHHAMQHMSLQPQPQQRYMQHGQQQNQQQAQQQHSPDAAAQPRGGYPTY